MKTSKLRWLLLAIAGIWCVSIMLAPALESASLYAFFSRLCHQIPERSWFLSGRPLAVCVRCFSIYLGFLAGLLFHTRGSCRSLKFALALTFCEWTAAHLGMDLPPARAVSGVLLGLAGADFVERGVSEMVAIRLAGPPLPETAAGVDSPACR